MHARISSVGSANITLDIQSSPKQECYGKSFTQKHSIRYHKSGNGNFKLKNCNQENVSGIDLFYMYTTTLYADANNCLIFIKASDNMISTQLSVKDKSDFGKSVKASAFKKDIRNTIPHKHNNYFEIVYLSEGSGTHYIDSRKFEVKPPVIYFIRKEQVHYWQLESEPAGFVVILKKAFVDESMDSELKQLLSLVSRENCVQVENGEMISTLFQLMTDVVLKNDKSTQQVIEGLLKAMLAIVSQHIQSHDTSNYKNSNLYQAFLSILNVEQMVKNKVHFYAERLNTSPQNLNAACRKAVGFAAEDVLAEYIISEAKRLLLYTGRTISEISFTLDFNDPSHFVKYFKRKTGQTPLSYRKTN